VGNGRPGVKNHAGTDAEFWHAWRPLASTGRQNMNSPASLHAEKLISWRPDYTRMSRRKSATKFIYVKAVSDKVVRNLLAYLSVQSSRGTKLINPLRKRRFPINIVSLGYITYKP